MSLLNSTYNNKRNLFGKLWDKALELSFLSWFPIIRCAEIVLYPDDKYENMGNISESHPMRLTTRGVITMGIMCLIFGIPCAAFSLLVLGVATLLSVPAVVIDTIMDSKKYWNNRYREICNLIFKASLHLTMLPYHCFVQLTSKPMAILASIPAVIPLLPLSLLIIAGGLATTAITSIFSTGEAIFRKVFCLSRNNDNERNARKPLISENEELNESNNKFTSTDRKFHEHTKRNSSKNEFGNTRDSSPVRMTPPPSRDASPYKTCTSCENSPHRDNLVYSFSQGATQAKNLSSNAATYTNVNRYYRFRRNPSELKRSKKRNVSARFTSRGV